MRASVLALCALPLLSLSALAADNPKDVKGLYLLTDYPAVSVQPGSTTNVTLRLQNYAIAPERYALSVSGVPAGWKATLLGGGQPVGAAMPATDSNVTLQLRLDVPADATASAPQTLTVHAKGPDSEVTLPIAVSLTKQLPAKLTVSSKLPDLRGSTKSSFDYQLTIKNDSGRALTASFAAEAPKNFTTSFTEAYGSQELSSIPIEAGQSKDIKLHVRPPSTIDAGKYPVKVDVRADEASASTQVSLEVVGQPQLRLSGRDGLVSARAQAGAQASVPIVVGNDGSAPADNVTLSANAPSGWKITFEPKTIARIEPGKEAEAQALITPSDKSLAGDYMTSMSAQTAGETGTAQFRVSVQTSTLWGMTGAGIIGAALLIMVGAVARFGRR